MPEAASPERPAGVDAVVLGRLREGDRSAFETVLRAYHPVIFRFAARMLGDPETASDIAQQTFLRLYGFRRRIDPRRGLRSWLFTVAQNLCTSHLRRRGLETRAVGRVRPPAGRDPADAVAIGETVRDALAGLPPDQRAVAILREYHGFTHEEIARIVGCSPGAARVKAHRARERLKELLRDVLD
jgi:RNA polymerase sigma-70 factor (ECF subfamily)